MFSLISACGALVRAQPALLPALAPVHAAGCEGRPGVATPWRQPAALAEAARRMARGVPAAQAARQAGYRATTLFQVTFRGYRDTAAMARAAASRYCAALTDPRLGDAAVHQEGDTTWLVLAAPFAPPAPQDAPAVAAEVLRLVNEARARPRRCGDRPFDAAPPLAPDATLDRAAAGHAQDMARHSYLEHRGRDGSHASERATRAGYRWRAVGENLASGPTSAREVVQGWLASPGHCANLMQPAFTEMGLAYAVDLDSEAGIYWAQVLARPR
ncbi:CAP domain-containing protein [Ramlibacter sp. MAHUQ-53]|uniref:CAP domain-containing protein n=1 Tax=unclassified Ramlibacter TaxID=2617605 RepID=UPI003631FABE